MNPQDLLRQGRLTECLSALQSQVRQQPADSKLRVFLFQLLAVMGQWERALMQLNVAVELDPKNLLMAEVGRAAIQCEVLRGEIFQGQRAPLIFGKPAEWVGLMVQANQLAANGKIAASQILRRQALESAPATAGMLQHLEAEYPFQWLGDADGRLGPILEAVIEGRYFWVPFECVSQLHLDPPADLRDLVWAPAQFVWRNGGTAVGLVPTRYAGSERSEDSGIQLSRKTEWADRGDELFAGLGQRVLATDEGEYPLLEIRRISFDAADAPAGG